MGNNRENEENINKFNNIEEKLEAIIFLSKEMITIKELAQFYGMENFEMEEVLNNLREKRKNTGINLKIENGIVCLVSNPLFGSDVKRFFNPEMKLKKLSRSAMETLAIIAYKGPITKAEIEQIRSVGVDKTMSNLLERKLIYISGRKKTAGTPNLYEVTDDFYNYLQKNALHIRDVNRNNKVITMSTCTESYTKGRIVLFGELIRR